MQIEGFGLELFGSPVLMPENSLNGLTDKQAMVHGNKRPQRTLIHSLQSVSEIHLGKTQNLVLECLETWSKSSEIVHSLAISLSTSSQNLHEANSLKSVS